jgi:hypothetical protein
MVRGPIANLDVSSDVRVSLDGQPVGDNVHTAKVVMQDGVGAKDEKYLLTVVGGFLSSNRERDADVGGSQVMGTLDSTPDIYTYRHSGDGKMGWSQIPKGARLYIDGELVKDHFVRSNSIKTGRTITFTIDGDNKDFSPSNYAFLTTGRVNKTNTIEPDDDVQTDVRGGLNYDLSVNKVNGTIGPGRKDEWEIAWDDDAIGRGGARGVQNRKFIGYVGPRYGRSEGPERAGEALTTLYVDGIRTDQPFVVLMDAWFWQSQPAIIDSGLDYTINVDSPVVALGEQGPLSASEKEEFGTVSINNNNHGRMVGVLSKDDDNDAFLCNGNIKSVDTDPSWAKIGLTIYQNGEIIRDWDKDDVYRYDASNWNRLEIIDTTGGDYIDEDYSLTLSPGSVKPVNAETGFFGSDNFENNNGTATFNGVVSGGGKDAWNIKGSVVSADVDPEIKLLINGQETTADELIQNS